MTVRVLRFPARGEVIELDTLDAAVPPPDDTTTWIDLVRPSADDLGALRAAFDFHPLAIEDCTQPNQRPKLEEYRDHLFVVTHAFESDDPERFPLVGQELHAFVGERYLVTVHDHDSAALSTIWERVRRDVSLGRRGTDFIYALVADAFVDSNLPVLDAVSERLEAVEAAVLDRSAQKHLNEILLLKRALLEMRRVMSPQRTVFTTLVRRTGPFVSERNAPYFREVCDAALRISEAIEAHRDHASNALSAYLSMSSNRTNEIMKSLTLVSAIFLPLSFITGFFGQNFAHLPFDEDWLMYSMVAACLLVPAGMAVWFRSRHWI